MPKCKCIVIFLSTEWWWCTPSRAVLQQQRAEEPAGAGGHPRGPAAAGGGGAAPAAAPRLAAADLTPPVGTRWLPRQPHAPQTQPPPMCRVQYSRNRRPRSGLTLVSLIRLYINVSGLEPKRYLI